MNELAINLSDLETLLSKSHCSCHFINPNKTRIILWKERRPDSELSSKEVKDNAVTYYLRLGIQKFISYPLTDKNGAVYWRFQDYAKSQTETETKETKALDPITKFQQRQEQTKDYAKPNRTEPAVNSQSN